MLTHPCPTSTPSRLPLAPCVVDTPVLLMLSLLLALRALSLSLLTPGLGLRLLLRLRLRLAAAGLSVLDACAAEVVCVAVWGRGSPGCQGHTCDMTTWGKACVTHTHTHARARTHTCLYTDAQLRNWLPPAARGTSVSVTGVVLRVCVCTCVCVRVCVGVHRRQHAHLSLGTIP